MAFNSHTLDLPLGSPRSPMSDFQSVRVNDGPLTLPSFVFPARASSASAPASFSRTTGRRPASAIELVSPKVRETTMEGEKTPATPELPSFSFGSGGQTPPASPRHIPGRSGTHKRATSEFIGGDGSTAKGTGLMSTSPPKSDGVLPPPTGFAPPSGRRGHKHVRSAAISQHDLSMIIKPPTSPNHAARGSSAPCSPSVECEVQQVQADIPTFPDSSPALPVESSSLPNAPTRALHRARVGFSENVEFIPRPLSLVSSDSSSTVTLRQGHSVSNSISSIISAGTSSPSSKENRGISTSKRISDARPRTAEPILSYSTAQTSEGSTRRNSIPLLLEAATASMLNAPSTPKSAKKWTFFSHDTSSGECSPRTRPNSAGSGPKETQPVTSKPKFDQHVQPPDTLTRSMESPIRRRSSSLSRKPTKKQKKVRNWAGSILSRKTRQRSQKQKLSRRSPTPPNRSYTPVDDTSAAPDFVFNEPAPPFAKPDQDIASWKPRKVRSQEDDSMSSPMIDLDAALGPFNTPSSFGDEWESSQQGCGTKKRAMHSAAGLGGFAGPGMHYHRRAESAPEFENPRFGLHRLGSSSTMGMEDVFEEEEEEDEWEDSKTSSDKEDSTQIVKGTNNSLGIDIRVEDAEDSSYNTDMDSQDGGSIIRGVKRKGSSLSEGDRRTVGSNAKSEHSATSLIDEPIQEESSSPVEILDDSSSSRSDSRAQSSDSTATPPFRSRPEKELTPVDIQPFALQPPYITPSSPPSTSQSSFPSPRSPFSWDAQRISTAPSSVTDEQGFQSLLLGEPGPELRYSVDDVPSLTSSNSTMTRESGHLGPQPHNPQFREGQRSASVSSAAATRKRSSMASLSRLISSSHGERSKLSIESRAPSSIDSETKEKGHKGRRISRMMQFWKPKGSSG
ncbi:hypothetical protein LOCC1_G005887 [Lachnellula occidentalis]|uniref:Cell wall proline rich protein n=1 Tax=Lachnellula occidentalis TaxID=215460 RepID=A0A8H8UEY5_9HELO|nr:hypothetical protein LOCC1_G005887 [Lachnellula occidentalis]